MGCACSTRPPFFRAMEFDNASYSTRAARHALARWARSAATGLAFVAATAGCYVYSPVAPETPAPGTQIRAEINDDGAAQLVSVFGPGVTRISGMVLNRDSGALSVLVDSYFSARVGDLLSANDPVRIGLGHFRYIEEKRLSTGRSILLGVAFVTGAALVMKVTGLDRLLFETEDAEVPEPPNLRPSARWLQWRIRLP